MMIYPCRHFVLFFLGILKCCLISLSPIVIWIGAISWKHRIWYYFCVALFLCFCAFSFFFFFFLKLSLWMFVLLYELQFGAQFFVPNSLCGQQFGTHCFPRFHKDVRLNIISRDVIWSVPWCINLILWQKMLNQEFHNFNDLVYVLSPQTLFKKLTLYYEIVFALILDPGWLFSFHGSLLFNFFVATTIGI